MWAWFLIGYTVFVATLAASAVRVALTCTDQARREMAFRVLKLVWGGGTAGALLAASLQLYGATPQ
jgi:hypothetical protein